MVRRRVHELRVLLLLAFIFAAGTAAIAPQAAGDTTIILVRHAEKATEPVNDPPLSPLGETRALALVDAVRSAGVQVIYSTPWKRTQQTAAPASRRLGIPVTTFDVTPGAQGYGELYAAELLSKHPGKVVLVVGHSNTVPAILRGLGVVDAPAITDGEYDNLYIGTVPASGTPRVVRAKFGAH